MRRRYFLVAALSGAFLLLAALTASASGSGERAMAPSGPATITYAYWGDQNEETTTTALLKVFMDKNPSITVNGQRFGSNTEFNDKITTLAASNTLPGRQHIL